MSDPAPLLTAGELGKYLKVTKRTIRAWRSAGKIPCKRISAKVVRYILADVMAALETEKK